MEIQIQSFTDRLNDAVDRVPVAAVPDDAASDPLGLDPILGQNITAIQVDEAIQEAVREPQFVLVAGAARKLQPDGSEDAVVRVLLKP